MPSTERRQRQIDTKLPATGGGAILDGGGAEPAGPGIPTPGAPQQVRILSTRLLYSAVTPQAAATVVWLPPPGATPDDYLVQWSTDVGFAAPTSRLAGRGQVSIGIDGLPVSTTIFVRVAARANRVQGAWSATASATTPEDTTPPDAPTSLTTSWAGLTGDLTIGWVNPTSVNLRDCRVRIYAAPGGTLLREAYSATGQYVWTRGQHYADTSGAYDPSVYLVITARSWGGVLSATELTGTATLAAPSAPSGLTTSWASDAGTAAADLLVTWTASPSVAQYSLSLNGVARAVIGGRYLYTRDQNSSENSGAADPTISVSLVAQDALEQSSTAATLTATNAAPPATTLTAFAGFSSVGLTINPSTALDLKRYRVRVYKSASLVRTVYVLGTTTSYAIEDGDGSYTFDVAAEDVFGQTGMASSQTTAVAVTDLVGFVTTLRSGLVYSDSSSTAASTLAALKDGNLTTPVVTYTGNNTWRWTQADWQEEVTTQTIEIAVSSTCSCYVGYSLDGASWTYYYGTAPSGGRWQPASSTSTVTTAQGGAQELTTGTWRIDIPAPRRARYIRVGHRHASTDYALREFFPATLVRGTYMEAESVTTLLLAANSVVADKIAGTTLSVLKASLGTVTIDAGGYLRSGQTAYNTGAGFWLGLDAGTPKFSIGNSAGSRLTWDGTNLALTGTIYASAGELGTLSVTGTVTAGPLQITSVGLSLYAGGVGFGEPYDPRYFPSYVADRAYRFRAADYYNAMQDVGGIYGAMYASLYSGGYSIITIAPKTAGPFWINYGAGPMQIGYATIRRVNIDADQLAFAGGYVYGPDGKEILRLGDTWLRLNQAGGYTSGVYTPGLFSAGGGIQVYQNLAFQDGGSITGAGNGTFAGTLSAAETVVSGSVAAHYFGDRTNGSSWAVYAADGIANIWSLGAGEIFRIGYGTGAAALRTTPWSGAALSVKGTGTSSSTYGLIVYDSANNNTFWVRDDGTGWLKNNPITYSDARMKRDIADLEEPLGTILRLRPRSFVRTDDPTGRRRLGLIAQEARAIIPEAFTLVAAPSRYGDTPDDELPEGATEQPAFWNAEYTALIAPLIGAVQELYQIVRQQEEVLQRRLSAGEDQLAPRRERSE